MHFIFFANLILILTLNSSTVEAAAAPTKAAPKTPTGPQINLPAGVQPMDGVNIEAVETYRNPKSRQIDFGLCVYPVDPYYNGFGIDLGYNHYFDKTYTWQVLDVNYIYSVDKDLRSQLAEKFTKNPKSIERLTFIASSSIQYVMAYGKFVFFKQHIRYFRSSLIGGPVYAVSNVRGTVGVNLGIRFETFVNDDFSWVLQIRDVYAPSNIDNNLVFGLGTAYAF